MEMGSPHLPVASVRMSGHLPEVEPPEDSSAHRFGSLIQGRGAKLDLEVTITDEAWSANGGYIIHVDGAADLLFEVDVWVEGVRVMNPHGEDVSVAEAVD